MEEELAAGLSEGEIAEFVEHDEVEAGQEVGDASLLAGAVLGLKTIDEIDHVEEPVAGATADKRAAIAMARCDVPVPVPPMSTALR